jgi:myo-inositol-1(or 4)-monophosphatase
MIDPTPAPPSGLRDYGLELATAIDAARAAGAVIREVFGKDQTVTFKSGDDPLTAADTAADRCIRERLRAAFPADGWLSEEGDARAGSQPGRVWVVDPLDGTREFVQHIPEFAVSVALMIDGRPTVAVVYNPIRDLLMSATHGGGVTSDGRSAGVSSAADLATAVVVASRSEVGRGQWSPYEARCRVLPTGSVAYKLALVACGEADATILRPSTAGMSARVCSSSRRPAVRSPCSTARISDPCRRRVSSTGSSRATVACTSSSWRRSGARPIQGRRCRT